MGLLQTTPEGVPCSQSAFAGGVFFCAVLMLFHFLSKVLIRGPVAGRGR